MELRWVRSVQNGCRECQARLCQQFPHTHAKTDRQTDRLQRTCPLIHLSRASDCVEKKDQTIWMNMNTCLSFRKRKFAWWISVCEACKGVALLCFATVATQCWQTPRAGDRLGPKERWFSAAMGNQCSNSKAWHRIWIQDFLTGHEH